MPPTNSMEKPPTAECTAGPSLVFSNSYARLPERFFARLAPTPVPKPRLIKFNELLASELGVDAQGREAGRAGGSVCRERHAAGRRADRDGLCRTSIRQFRSSAWRRPRNPPRRGSGPQRGAARRPIEGRGQNAVLAARRRSRRTGAGPARISRQRSDACARNSDHTGAGGRLNRRTRFSRPPVTWSRANPCRIQSHPGRHLPILCGAPRPRSRRTAIRLRH